MSHVSHINESRHTKGAATCPYCRSEWLDTEGRGEGGGGGGGVLAGEGGGGGQRGWQATGYLNLVCFVFF